MLTILQCGSDIDAERAQRTVRSLVEQVLDQNQEILERIDLFEAFYNTRLPSRRAEAAVAAEDTLEVDDVESVITALRDFSTSDNVAHLMDDAADRHDFEDVLGRSRVYLRAQTRAGHASILTGTARTDTRSVLSLFTLADVPDVGTLPVPVSPQQLQVSQHHLQQGAAYTLVENYDNAQSSDDNQNIDPEFVRWLVPRVTQETAEQVAAVFAKNALTHGSATIIDRISKLGMTPGRAPRGSEKRIMKEWVDIAQNPPPSCIAAPIGDDLAKWKGYIFGPADSPYSGGVFALTIRFPEPYPFKPVQISFETRIFHPNIAHNGEIGIDTLRESWGAYITISQVLVILTAILADPIEPFDCFGLRPDAVRMFRTNKEEYKKTARDWTERYAV